VVVVGAGIVGATAAWQLARRGADVVLAESDEPGRATSAGAGIVQPWRSATTGSWAAYSDLAGATWPRLAAELAAGGTDPSYAGVGGLTVSRDVAALQAMAEELATARTARGWTGLGEVELLAPGAATARFPVLAADLAAVWAGGVGRVDGRRFRDAALAVAERAGVTRLDGRAELVVAGSRVRGVRVTGEEVAADAVVLAAGAWTAALCAPLGVTPALAPMRGQIVHLQVPDAGTATWPTVMTLGEEHGHHYVLAFPGGRVVVGATREPDAGFDHRVTAAGQRQVLDAALALAPGLADATVLETRVGFRPVTPDGFPLLGAVPGVDGLVVATGLGANGLTYGPLMGVLAAGLALGEPPPFDLTPFAPTR
jgi:D-amino-acid dehydrogenase